MITKKKKENLIKVLNNNKNEIVFKYKRQSRFNVNKEVEKWPEVLFLDNLIFEYYFSDNKDRNHLLHKLEVLYRSNKIFNKYKNILEENKWIFDFKEVQELLNFKNESKKEKEINIQGEILSIDFILSLAKDKKNIFIEHITVKYKKNYSLAIPLAFHKNDNLLIPNLQFKTFIKPNYENTKKLLNFFEKEYSFDFRNGLFLRKELSVVNLFRIKHKFSNLNFKFKLASKSNYTIDILDSKNIINQQSDFSEKYIDYLISLINEEKYIDTKYEITLIDIENIKKNKKLVFNNLVFNEDIKKNIAELKKAKKVEKKIDEKIDEKINKKGFIGELREHQNIGVNWIYSLYKKDIKGAILADDMGMGKTIQTIAFLSLIDFKRAVILAPASVVTNWKSEIEKFNPKILNKILITSYESFRNGVKLKKDDILILDESQKLKNKQTIVSKIILNTDVKFELFLSGTPIENKIDDIFTIILMIYPKLEKVLRRLKKIKDINSIITIFRNLIDGIYLSRKIDQNILPVKLIETKMNVVSNKLEKNIYKKIENFYSRKLKKIDNNTEYYREAIVGLMRMIQLISTPRNLPDEFLKNLKIDKKIKEKETTKAKKLFSLTEKIIKQNEKVIIFVLFKETIKMILKEYPDTLVINGSVSKKERGEIIKEFQENNDKKIIIISLRAGATGITLTSANHTIFYDLWWNPAVMDQAMRRNYRIGQEKDCYAYYLISDLKIDKLIYETNLIKKELRNNFDKNGEKRIEDKMSKILIDGIF